MRLALDQDLPALSADPTQLERAFANLLDNAVVHGEGQPVLVRSRLVGPRLVVRVVDRGPGIPENDRERIFEPFYRSAGSGNGSGLGLAIARGFIEANGGEVEVESLPGQGSSFVVSFEAPGGVPVSAAPRVLVCDDEPQILRALKVILRDAGYEAVPATTGEEALDLAAVKPPEAAILDLMLPDLDGVEVTRRLREWTRMPILVLSAVGRRTARSRRWRPAPTTT